jgi:pilus assembly protein FimV
VHSQIEDWRGGAAAKPTLVADTGTKPEPKVPAPVAKTPAPKTTTSTASTAPKTGNERLELVPPKAGKDTLAMADRPGAGAGSGAATSELKSELARTKEALTSRDQETTELKSRVKELEDIKGKSDRQLTLKDSEIADLQNKLKELREQESKSGTKPASSTASTTPTPVATTPAAPSSASTTSPTAPATTATSGAAKTEGTTKADKVSKEDIWGNASTTPDTKTPGTTAGSSTPAGTAPSGTASTTTPSSSPTATTATPGTGATTPPTTSTMPSTGNTSESTATPSSSTSVTPPASTTTPASTATPGSTPSTTPSTSTPPATKPAASSTSPAKPAATTRMEPLTTSGPVWYEAAWVKPAAIGAAALLLLAGLLGMRKRKAAAVATGRGSIAGAFGDSPLREDDALGLSSAESEEDAIRDQLMHDPANVGLHLELLSLLYAERNVGAFEDAAELMHAHVTDAHQPEWLEVKAMGQELAPHNPLFSDGADMHSAFDDEAVTAPHTMPSFDHDDVFGRREPAAPATQANTAFDFDLEPDLPATGTNVPQPSEAAFSFDNLPPVDFAKEAHHEMEAAVAPAPLQVDEDEFPGEDGVGTKLDLAKAYLDMGDPEGARSMLEEVLAEGNDVQKGEARRLMTEIK